MASLKIYSVRGARERVETTAFVRAIDRLTDFDQPWYAIYILCALRDSKADIEWPSFEIACPVTLKTFAEKIKTKIYFNTVIRKKYSSFS